MSPGCRVAPLRLHGTGPGARADPFLALPPPALPFPGWWMWLGFFFNYFISCV